MRLVCTKAAKHWIREYVKKWGKTYRTVKEYLHTCGLTVARGVLFKTEDGYLLREE
jgi:hypothetical protein